MSSPLQFPQSQVSLSLLLALSQSSLGPGPQPGFGSDFSCLFVLKNHSSIFSEYGMEWPGAGLHLVSRQHPHPASMLGRSGVPGAPGYEG